MSVRPPLRRLLVAALAAAGSAAGASVCLAQPAATAGGEAIAGWPSGETPNLNGKWINATPMAPLKAADGKDPPLNARGRAEYARHKANMKADPIALCQMQGEPRLLYAAHPFLILQYDTHVDFVHEVNHTFRIVKFGARLDPDADPWWLGHPSARWEGRTLVIDSAAFNDKTWLDYSGLPHSDKLRTEERYTVSPDGQTIHGTVRIDDPTDYAKPWATTFTLKKLPGYTLKQLVCEDDHQM